jgi:hypothetical protein
MLSATRQQLDETHRQQQPTRQGDSWSRKGTQGDSTGVSERACACAGGNTSGLRHATQEQLQPTRDATNRQDGSRATAANRTTADNNRGDQHCHRVQVHSYSQVHC